MIGTIHYRVNAPLEAGEIVRVLRSSGIRRPVDEPGRIGRMFANSNLVVSAWDGERLAGLARSITDFSYCCYLSDLAVERDYQRRGIGRALVERTREEIGEEVSLMLVSAPEAASYYPALGFAPLENAFRIPRIR
jgi:GNAT superfamily N-acetyltransferase